MAILVVCIFALDRYTRYASWKNLSSQTVKNETQWYLENRTFEPGSVKAICIYVVECSAGVARLQLTENLTNLDFDKLRQTIWDRRFKRSCTGQTANLGLHIVRDNVSDAQSFWYSDRAIWSFNNNRFIPIHGRFAGGSFSEEPWERCSLPKATYAITDEGFLAETTTDVDRTQ